VSDEQKHEPPAPGDESPKGAESTPAEGAPPATWAGRARAGEPQKPEEDAEPAPDASGAGDADTARPRQGQAEPGPGGVDVTDAESVEGDVAATDADSVESDVDAERAQESEPGQKTVEAQTPALADREQAKEAALAGLRARAAGKGPEPHAAKPAAAEPTPAPAAGAPEPQDGETPRAKPLWARFLAASLLIVISMATATSVSLLLYLTDIARGLGDDNAFTKLQDQLEAVEGGDPQTILILGSDERLSEKGVPGRSDTALLLRVDPDRDAIALLSIPRDLKVSIPRVGVDKFNVAYSVGGPKLTLDVVRQLTGLDIHHVVNINFTGFADAVNAIDCVYIDVDRRYFIPPEASYAEIDIEAGYQRLCGLKALQYVRYRYDDNDLVRSARQQDFVREARQKLEAEKIVRDFSYRNKLIDIFTDFTTSDIDDPVTMLELLKTFIGAANATVSEVHFPAELGDGNSPYVTASAEAIKSAVQQFLGGEGTPGARPAGTDDPVGEEPPGDSGGKDKPKEPKDQPEPEGPPMIDATAVGQQYGQALADAQTKGGDLMVKFPIYFPSRLVPGSTINDATRAFPIDGPEKQEYRGYKFVVGFPGSAGFSEYYGVSGTNWTAAPILENASETREIDGRDYQLFYDGDRLRLIGWKTKKAAYWVNNSLLQTLEEGELISIATSMRKLGG
jgi:LCP family protein required for cell wall assembly